MSPFLLMCAFHKRHIFHRTLSLPPLVYRLRLKITAQHTDPPKTMIIARKLLTETFLIKFIEKYRYFWNEQNQNFSDILMSLYASKWRGKVDHFMWGFFSVSLFAWKTKNRFLCELNDKLNFNLCNYHFWACHTSSIPFSHYKPVTMTTETDDKL